MTNNIVLGARADAEDLKAMRGLGISYVLNISDKVPNHFPDVLVYRRINIPGMYVCMYVCPPLSPR